MINAWIERGKIKASYRKNGVLEIRTIGSAEYTGFVKDPTVLQGMSGIVSRKADFDGWTKLNFVDYDTRKLIVEHNPGLVYEGDVSPVRRFISDNKTIIEPPLRCYFDLETDSDVAFDQAFIGQSPLLSWAAADDLGNKYGAVLQDNDLQAEAELWAELWRYLGNYDQAAAWGGDRFDFPVAKERSEILAKMFPDILEPYWEHRRRLLMIDHLEVFKRHHMAPDSGNDKTSNKLGDVGFAMVGEGKEEVPEELAHLIGKGKGMGGSTRKLWNAGGAARQALLDYNIQDAVLMQKIEAKTGYLELQQTIAEVTNTFCNSHGIRPVAFVDGYMLKLAHERKTHLPSKKPPTGDEKEYEGALVMDTKIKGIMKMIHVCDFKSLYPTVIRTWNLGTETKGGNGARALNGVSFGNDIESMLAKCCRDFMDLRDFYKKEMQKLTPGTEEHKSAERKSKAYKIANNSVYGAQGCIWCRLYDVEVAEAITLGAKMLLETTRDAAIQRGMNPVAGDTDSLFIGQCSVEEFTEFVRWCNEDLYPRTLDKYNCKPEFRCIGLAYEKCFERLIAPQAKTGDPASKRYAGSYHHYAGMAGRPVPAKGEVFDKNKHSKPEIKGLEYMRGDSVRIGRQMQKECIDMLMAGEEDPEVFQEWIKRKRGAFMTGPVAVEDIALTKGISRGIASYKVKGPHVRVAELMAAEGLDVSEGTRVSYIVVDGKASPSVVIPAETYDGKFDRHFYWNSGVYPPTLRLLAGAFPSINWNRWIAKRPKPVAPGQMGMF